MKSHGELVGSIDVVHESIRRGLCAAKFALKQGIERPLHITRCKWPSVVKHDPTMQMKYVCKRVRNLPPLCQPWLNIEVFVAGQQRVEDKLVNPLGLPINTHSRVKICRAAFNNHHQQIRIRSLRAGE